MAIDIASEITAVAYRVRGEISSLISAIDFASLPSISLNSLGSCDALPGVPCLYFLTHPQHGMLYVGKAKNLLRRWRSSDVMTTDQRLPKHHHHLRCISIGNVYLLWMKLECSVHDVAEIIAIETLKPAWNKQTMKPNRNMPEMNIPCAIVTSLRAKELMKILLRECQGRNFCVIGRDALAGELGISKRQTGHHLAVLSQAGMIEIQRGNRANRYWIPPRQKQVA